MRFYITLLISLLVPIGLLSAAWLFRGDVLEPEALILGKWKEVSWNYVKADNKGSVQFGQEPLSKAVRHLISSAKLIHKAEEWDFHPASRLELHNADDVLQLDWSIVGNGNVLRLRYNDAFEECYQLVALTKDKMVLQFGNEQLTRGIVRIEFLKN